VALLQGGHLLSADWHAAVRPFVISLIAVPAAVAAALPLVFKSQQRAPAA